MFFSACGAPKFDLRSERPFQEIARHGGPRLLWRAVYLSIWSPKCDSQDLNSSTCGLSMRMRRHGPAARYVHHSGMLLTVPACALHRLFRSPA